MQGLPAYLIDWIDGFLIFFYRLPGDPLVGFFIGTITLSFFCVLAGEFTISLAIRFNRHYLDEMSREINETEKLSMVAYNSGDKDSYKALNKQATDAWGKHFFTTAAYSAGILWPIPFALGWMEYRFAEIRFPFLFSGWTVNYFIVFLACYVLMRIVFAKIRRKLPYFKGVHQTLLGYEQENLDYRSREGCEVGHRHCGNVALNERKTTKKEDIDDRYGKTFG
jgi:hypothetical protein